MQRFPIQLPVLSKRRKEESLLRRSLRVGELAKVTGKTVRALHLYEELGLLAPSERSKGGYRLYDEAALQLVRDTLVITLKLAAPILAAGVVVGLLVSIFQSVTSIQDQTITFVPKIVVMVIVSAVLLPWIAARLMDFARDLFSLASG